MSPVPADPPPTPHTPQELRYWGRRCPRKVHKYPCFNKHARRGSTRHALLQMQQAREPKGQEMRNSRGERRNLRAPGEVQRDPESAVRPPQAEHCS